MDREEGLSIIVCSIDPERLRTLKDNISATVGEGVTYEVLSHDNREAGWPLAKVYNHLAGKARFRHLLFIHEDVSFESRGWYGEVSRKLDEPGCGVIGFAGAVIMPQAPGGWAQTQKYNRLNLKERDSEYRVNIAEGEDFTEVVTLDGLAMFVRHDLWARFPFDEEHLKGFHCYDVDFTLSMGGECRHYVSNHVLVRHDSSGVFGKAWMEASLNLYYRKWRDMLPRQVSGISLGEKEMEAEGERVSFRTLKKTEELGLDSEAVRDDFFRRRNTLRHIGHILKWIIWQIKR